MLTHGVAIRSYHLRPVFELIKQTGEESMLASHLKHFCWQVASAPESLDMVLLNFKHCEMLIRFVQCFVVMT